VVAVSAPAPRSSADAGRAPEALPAEAVCAQPAGERAPSRPGAAPFERPSGECREPGFCDVAERAPAGADACFVATPNIGRAERESRATAPGRPVTSSPWDRTTTPRHYGRVDAHLHLDDAEKALLRANGFVVLGRARYASYAVAFHDVFQQQLPVYVGVDAVFQAVFRASESILGEVERTNLGPRIAGMLDRMRATLAASRARYDAETLADLDVYLTVAHKLLRTAETKPLVAGSEPLVEALVQSATAASSLDEVELFGRRRMIDWTQMTPRGHYVVADPEHVIHYRGETIATSSYFTALMWLSRLELNLVSRSSRSSHPGPAPDPTETPREARDALALADLATRASALADLRAIEDVYSVFGGKREDVSIPEIAALAARHGIGPRDPDAPAKLAAAIGDGHKRTARTHFTPEGTTELPAITTMLGPRVVPDVAPLTRLVHDKIPDRDRLGAADVAFALGSDRAKSYLAGDLARHPTLASALDEARAELASGARGKTDVYSTWLTAITRAAARPEGAVPSFMRTDAYADMQMSSTLAAFAELRHTFVLLAAQGYDAYGCEIPDGWVEPALPVYDALLAWSRAAQRAVPARAAYFRRAAEILGMLRGIAATELAGAPLSEPQRRWLGMVSEYTPTGGFSAGDSSAPPKYTGWYFDLFPDRESGASKAVDLVADTMTFTNAGEVHYVGVESAALGVFVVDTGGEPRAMVGPVTMPYETTTPIAKRLDDEAARKAEKQAAWLSYVARARPPVPLSTRTVWCEGDVRVVVSGDRPLGDVSVELLDHHGDALTAPARRTVGTSPGVFVFDVPAAVRDASFGIEGVHLRVHERTDAGGGPWDAVVAVSAWEPGTNVPWMADPFAPRPRGPKVFFSADFSATSSSP